MPRLMMPFLPDLTLRRRQPEIMDQPGLEESAHVGALRALERINRISGSAGIIWREVRALARQQGRATLRLLDVASGAGDVPLRLWRTARRAGIDLRIAGCDTSRCALEHARRRAEEQGAALDFFQVDVLNEPLPGDYDVVTSSLFLHHLDDEPALVLLAKMKAAARRLVLIDDLARGRLGYLLAYWGTRLLSQSPVAQVDGPLSVQGAYTPEEALALAGRAGLAGATVRRRWPCRFLLKWTHDE